MIKAKIKDVEYNIPMKWSELTYRQYSDLQNTEGEKETLSVITGIPLDLINQIEEDQLIKLYLLVQFVRVKFTPDNFETPDNLTIEGKQIPYIKDICEKTFGQKIYFQELMKGGLENLFDIIPDIVSIYSQPYIDGKEFDINRLDEIKLQLEQVFFVDLYSTALGYIEQMKNVLEIEAKTLVSKPDQNQIMAGVDRFQQFGVMNTIKALANNDVTKYAEIERLEYNTVFVHMRMNKEQNDFNDNYRKVLEQQRKK